ncbi:MAG: CHAD domain-containing protein [Terriglobia bacterium]
MNAYEGKPYPYTARVLRDVHHTPCKLAALSLDYWVEANRLDFNSGQGGGLKSGTRGKNPSAFNPFQPIPMNETQADISHNHTHHVHSPATSSGAVPPADEWNKVRKLALRHLNRFISLEAKVLKGEDPDAIHDMRVASRRLQQILDLIFPAPLPREARRLRRKIRRCRRALGDVRNCDVLLEHAERRLARRRSSNREALTAVKQYIQERRSESFTRAIRKLSKLNLAVFYMRTKAILDRLGPKADQGHIALPPAHTNGVVLEPFPARLAQALVRVWNEFEKQVAVSQSDPRATSIHAARIGAKRLRYLLEVVSQFGMPGSSQALAWLRRIQQHLGDWHDMEVLEEMIVEMMARPQFLRDHLPLALVTGKLILRNRATKQGFRDKYFRMTVNPPSHLEIKAWMEGLQAAPALAKV